MKQFRSILIFALIDIKRSFRDKTALFFIFVFPLIFLFVFGGIFGGNNGPSFNVALLNQADNSFTKEFLKNAQKDDLIKINKDIKTESDAREKMKRGEIDAIIKLPGSFGEVTGGQPYPSGQAEVVVDQNSAQAGATLKSIFDAIFNQVNKEITKAPTPFTAKLTVSKEQGLNQFDYTFAGLLGFSILSLGIFGPTSVFPRMKQQGILRRYHTTTLRVWQFFTANVLSQMFVGVLSVALMFAVALTFFDLNMRGDYLTMLVVVLLGTATMFGVGLAVGGWAKNENQAAPLANLITFPMMFLSGTFFPRFLMPDWLQTISGLLPLTPIVDALRFVVTEGRNLFEIGPELGLTAIWLVVIYVIAFRVFRWD
ncbi:MAG TPA: ABC transporter permease [Candidatus Saccharibacteria bacterium]|nr:ABC transporter permease [Candidatus Saccharibacteria bacterium]HRK93829.1 ABC transporter permease [Candidatus Saccharibacteria bacterium]